MENICKNCHWYKPNASFSDNITCVHSLKKVKDTDTCEDFCVFGGYEPTGIWAEMARVVEAVGEEVSKREKPNDK